VSESSEPFFELLSGDDVEKQQEVLVYLSGHVDLITDQLVPVLVDMLGSESKQLRRCSATVLALGLRRGVGRGDLTRALADGDRRRRFGAAFVCFEGGVLDETGFDVCLGTLGDRSSDTRWAASSIVVDRAHVFDCNFTKLFALLGSHCAEQRRMTLSTLRDLGVWNCRRFVSGLSDPIAAVRIAALAAIIRNRPPADGNDRVGDDNQGNERNEPGRPGAQGRQISQVRQVKIDEALVRVLRDDRVARVRRVAASALSRSRCLSPLAHEALHLATMDSDATLARLAQRVLQRRGRATTDN